MKLKILNALLIVTSLFGYLEWPNNSAFLWQAELDLIAKLFSDPVSVLHPFTLLPMLGQIALLVTLFQTTPSRALTIAGIVCLGLLLFFIFAIGLLSVNIRVTLSTLPFVVVAILTIWVMFRKPSGRNGGTSDDGSRYSS